MGDYSFSVYINLIYAVFLVLPIVIVQRLAIIVQTCKSVFLSWERYYITVIVLNYEIFHMFKKLKSLVWGPRLTCQIRISYSELSFSMFPFLFLPPAIFINLSKLNFLSEDDINPRSFF